MSRSVGVLLLIWAFGCAGAGSADESSCEDGSAIGCFNAARALEKANGDPARVDALYQKGCDLGNPNACNNLAVLLLKTDGPLATDAVRARQLYGRGCTDLEDADNCSNLAVLELAGTGGDKDVKAAQRHLEAACGDSQLGCFNLGLCYATDCFGPPNPPYALQYLQFACNRDHGQACYIISGMLNKGQGGPADPDKAKVLADKACKLGVNEACAGPMP